MNPKQLRFSYLFLLVTLFFCSCGDETTFVVCKANEHDCEYDIYPKAGEILTVTKGSSRKHYILTENGLKKAKIKEGEPLAYNPVNKLAVIEEKTDSSIEVSVIDTENGKTVSSGIEIPIFEEEHEEENEKFSLLSSPSVESACITGDGTVILLVDYDQMPTDLYSEHFSFLFVYEKGSAKNIRKYAFPNSEKKHFLHTLLREEAPQIGFEESPLRIQCGKNGEIYLLSAKIWESDYTGTFQSVYNLEKVDLDPQEGKSNITHAALIAFDEMQSCYYSEKEKRIYAFLKQGKSAENAVLRTLELGESEIPDKVIEKEDGRFFFSETKDGSPLVFFLKNRKNAGEEQRIELIDIN